LDDIRLRRVPGYDLRRDARLPLRGAQRRVVDLGESVGAVKSVIVIVIMTKGQKKEKGTKVEGTYLRCES
jgi:hypothetical protein